MPAGIDDIVFFGPKLYLDTSLLEEKRGKSPGLISNGLGLNKQAMNDSNQDAMTNAANAVLLLMERNKLSPSDISRLDVATESSLDESKGANSYIIGMLEKFYKPGSFSHCGGREQKFACVAGSYAVEGSVKSVLALSTMKNTDKINEIVVMTDTAKYELNSPGELTQGSGAVAVLINNSPRIADFELNLTSTYIRNLYDFHRIPGRETPNVYGDESELAYLLQTKGALQQYMKNAAKEGLISCPMENFLDYIGYINAHIPYPKMAEKALLYFIRHLWRGTDKMKSIVEKLGIEEPLPPGGSMESFFFDEKYVDRKKHTITDDGKKFLKIDSEFNKKMRDLEEYQNLYKSKVESSLIFPAEIGNIYTGSMWLAMISTLENEHKRGSDMSDKRILGVSYGSGSNSMVFSLKMRQKSEYSQVIGKMDLSDRLDKRVSLEWNQYEDLHEHRLPPDKSILDKKKYEGQFVLRAIEGGERRYMIA
jgi:hydroxymethylglutaryl-CoA synthase